MAGAARSHSHNAASVANSATAANSASVPNSASAPVSGSSLRLSIGQVLEQLQPEFPSLTISKLRFLENQGLVAPHRSPSGYRQFSRDDVERIRFVLECQRDRFWPLKVIRQRLEELDDQQSDPPGPRAVDSTPHSRLSAEELAQQAAVGIEFIAEIDRLGLIKKGPSNRYKAEAIAVVRAISQLSNLGIDARHLRAFRAAADREAGLVNQIAAPLRKSNTAAGIARAQNTTEEVMQACLALHAALLEDTVSQLDQ